MSGPDDKIVFGRLFSNINEEIDVFMNKPVYLGLSILEISRIVMSKFCCDYVKAKLCYMDTDNFIFFIEWW